MTLTPDTAAIGPRHRITPNVDKEYDCNNWRHLQTKLEKGDICSMLRGLFIRNEDQEAEDWTQIPLFPSKKWGEVMLFTL